MKSKKGSVFTSPIASQEDVICIKKTQSGQVREKKKERERYTAYVGVFFTSVGLADALRMHSVSGGRSSWACTLLLVSLQLWGKFHAVDVS